MFRNGNYYNSTRHAIADILLCYAKLVDLWVYLVVVDVCMYIVNACNIIFIITFTMLMLIMSIMQWKLGMVEIWKWWTVSELWAGRRKRWHQENEMRKEIQKDFMLFPLSFASRSTTTSRGEYKLIGSCISIASNDDIIALARQFLLPQQTYTFLCIFGSFIYVHKWGLALGYDLKGNTNFWIIIKFNFVWKCISSVILI